MTIEKDPQVCVDEHFQHEIASRDPALVCSGEKSQRHLAHWDQDHHDQSLVGDTFRWVRGCWHNIKIFSPFRHLESLLMSASILVELMIVRRQSLPIPCSSLSPWLLSRFWRESSIWEWTEEAAVGGGSTFQTETPVELATQSTRGKEKAPLELLEKRWKGFCWTLVAFPVARDSDTVWAGFVLGTGSTLWFFNSCRISLFCALIRAGKSEFWKWVYLKGSSHLCDWSGCSTTEEAYGSWLLLDMHQIFVGLFIQKWHFKKTRHLYFRGSLLPKG